MEEQEELAYWLRQIGDDELEAQLEQQWNRLKYREQLDEGKAGQMLASILEHKTQKPKWAPVFALSGRIWRFAAAAVLLMVVGVSGYLYWMSVDRQEKPPIADARPVTDLAPGTENAILTLADGRQIVLDTTSGKVTQEDGVTVFNLKGQLNYDTETLADSGTVSYHTLRTPNGGQYQLVLADGSKVWLNAASSLRFPTAFAGKNRSVELSGEGYFEVAPDASKPFHVTVGDMDVQVLGTHFNINAYRDEKSINTTLLEGSVKVSARKAEVILKPGSQAQLYQPLKSSKSNGLQVVNNVDLDGIIAWKKGYFSFENADIATIMRQLSRWYDIEVVYESNSMAYQETFSGKVHRSMSLRSMLEVLSFSQLDVKLDGRKLIVSANSGALKK